MSSISVQIDQAQHQHRPVAVYLGERKFTQLVLDVAQLGARRAQHAAGRPLAYRNLELLRDEVNVDTLRVI